MIHLKKLNLMKSKICFIDFETTGIDVFKDSPVEIGAVLINSKGCVQKRFHKYIKPRTKRKVSKAAEEIHGLTNLDLLSKSPQHEVIESFFDEFGTDFRFGGWNINFDISFFRSICHHSNKMRLYNRINHRHIDVQTISFLAKELGIISPKYNSLTDLASLFSIERSTKHSALEDAIITSQVYFNLVKLFKEK